MSLELQGDFLIEGQKIHIYSHPSIQCPKENSGFASRKVVDLQMMEREGVRQKCQAKTFGARSIHLASANTAPGVSAWLVPRRM